MSAYPKVKSTEMVGTYPALVKSGGGYVWDEVLEYRVWCHPGAGAPDIEDGDDYYYVFDNYEDALEFSKENQGCEDPLALILQKEYIAEPQPGKYMHIKEQRIAEWPVEFLSRPKRNENTIPDFLSPNAPANRLDILRGLTA
ncbi:hypothetical protein MTO98_02790 [Mucilaginibacter sp. SMC90]|uniref:hypothetical protein n=1 Tax=Mucilaginibacter sp. SMC90 TaxID=2929803 RepID=UPI001FB3D117|nr:hypothetical protein [Mucilaginibacter sp. SMC90]UOE49997.1 hypothetical protein MTO98_02790 [Mucilaginibacter sp. SMC90]